MAFRVLKEIGKPGTNDIVDDNEKLKFVDKAVELSRKRNTPKHKSPFPYTRKVRDLKRNIKKHCMKKSIPFIDNDNISQEAWKRPIQIEKEISNCREISQILLKAFDQTGKPAQEVTRQRLLK